MLVPSLAECKLRASDAAALPSGCKCSGAALVSEDDFALRGNISLCVRVGVSGPAVHGWLVACICLPGRTLAGRLGCSPHSTPNLMRSD